MRAELLIDRLRHLSLPLICALTALVPHAALSHGPAPAPLAVLSFDASGERAALVRTSIGLAKDYPPADWTYVCPSQFGDREQARASYLEASQTTITVGGGAIYRSNDGACTFEAVTQEDESYALDVSAIAGAFWLIALDEGEEGRVLLRVTAEGPAQRIKAFQGEGALRVDSIAALGGSGLIALASSPSPTLIFGLGDATDPATLTWSSEPLADLPESTSHLELRRVSPEGELWMVAATEAGRELWHGEPSETLGEGPRAWRRVGEAATTLLGPAAVGERLLLVRDGHLEAEQSGSWEGLGEVNYTALDEVGGRVVACTLTQALHLQGAPNGGIGEAVIFDMGSLIAPLEGCPPSPSGKEACEGDWIHFGAEVGLLDPEKLSTPAHDRDTPSVQASDTQGCEAGGGLPLGMALITLAFCGLMRRRRRTLSGGPSNDL